MAAFKYPTIIYVHNNRSECIYMNLKCVLSAMREFGTWDRQCDIADPHAFDF